MDIRRFRVRIPGRIEHHLSCWPNGKAPDYGLILAIYRPSIGMTSHNELTQCDVEVYSQLSRDPNRGDIVVMIACWNNIVVVIECTFRIWEFLVFAVGHKSINSMWKLSRRKSDFGGIRTHARKTAALTQRLRPLGHEVTHSESGTRTPVCCVRGSYDNHLHQFGWLENSGIEPETSCMLSTRSTNWANPPSCDTCGIPVADSVADSSDWLSHWVIRLTWAASHQICAIHNLTSQLLRLLATAVAFTSVDCRLCHGHFHTATTTARS